MQFHAPTTTKLNTQFIATTATSVSVNQMKNTERPDRKSDPAERNKMMVTELEYVCMYWVPLTMSSVRTKTFEKLLWVPPPTTVITTSKDMNTPSVERQAANASLW